MANTELTLEDINKTLGKMMIMLTDLGKQVEILTEEVNKKPKEVLKLEDVTKMLQKSRSAIYALVAAGAIPAHRNGKRLYFFHGELVDWIENSQNLQYKQLVNR